MLSVLIVPGSSYCDTIRVGTSLHAGIMAPVTSTDGDQTLLDFLLAPISEDQGGATFEVLGRQRALAIGGEVFISYSRLDASFGWWISLPVAATRKTIRNGNETQGPSSELLMIARYKKPLSSSSAVPYFGIGPSLSFFQDDIAFGFDLLLGVERRAIRGRRAFFFETALGLLPSEHGVAGFRSSLAGTIRVSLGIRFFH